MKNKLLIVAATFTLVGCGTVADITTGPATIASTQGIEAAKEWCKQREADLAGLGALAHIGGGLFDFPFKVAVAPVEAVVGPVLHGTSVVRDQQCATLTQ